MLHLSAERGFIAPGASVYRSFRHEPRGSFRLCPSSLRRTARKGRLTLKRKHLRESLSLHCVTRHPSFAVCSGNASISLSLLVSSTSPKTDTSPAHLDYTPTPDPDARCDDALTPLRQSANHFTHSEFAYGLGQGQVGTLLQGKPITKCLSLHCVARHLPFALRPM